MTGARAVAAGVLVLAAVCVVPAVSAAQESGSPPPDTTTTSPEPSLPADPAPPPTTTSTSPAQQDPKGAADQADPQSQPAPQESGDSPSVTVSSADSAGRAHAAASTRVTMQDFSFSPASVTVSVGDIVTWHNSGHAPHTATADDGSFDTGTVAAGQSASHMFTSPGTFSYVCTIHPNMHGTVRVLAASGSGGSGGGGGTAGSSSTSGPTEAQAVASPNAAGNSTTLPMTGMPAGVLALVGLALLASGLIVRYVGRPFAAEISGAPAGWQPLPAPATVTRSSGRPATGRLGRRGGALVLLLLGLLLLSRSGRLDRTR